MVADREPPAPVDAGRRRLALRSSGLAALLLAVAAGLIWLVTRDDAPLALGVALSVTLLLDGAVARRSLAAPDLRLDHPVDAVAGREIGYVTVARSVDRPLQVTVPTLWGAAVFAVDSSEPGVIRLPGHGRGVVDHQILVLEVTGPLGFVRCTRRLRVWFRAPLLVGPAPVDHELEWPRPTTVRFGVADHAPVGDELFRGVRPYVRGDSRRRVHWKATAHHGRLMVEEADGTGVVVVGLVVDLRRPGGASELAAGRAARVGQDALRRGWVVELITVEDADPAEAPSPVDSTPLPFSGAAGGVAPRRTRTVIAPVRSPLDLQRRLAAASYGSPALGSRSGVTRLLTSEGDRWS